MPLQAVKPVLVRSTFQDEKKVRDVLGLSKLVDDRLREAAAVPRGAKLVVVDVAEFPGGVQVAGRYKIEGTAITVGATMFEGEKEVGSFAVVGETGKPDELAAKIAAEVEKKLSVGTGK